jgi:NAD+ synthase (glutamine-hydrolysing)
MSTDLRIALAQLNLVVGDVVANTGKILSTARTARDEQRADLVVFPELAVTGYPPEDLLFHSRLRYDVARAMARLKDDLRGVAIVVGYPEYDGDAIHNSAALIHDGELIANHRKQCLPNYGVFDEMRYFEPGAGPTVVAFRGFRLALTVCEDLWEAGPPAQARAAGAELLLSINGSPYDMRKRDRRLDVLARNVSRHGLPQVYLNMVGGQDELVFDGGSMVLDENGAVVHNAPGFEEYLGTVTFRREQKGAVPRCVDGKLITRRDGIAEIYEALVLGTRDYVDKHGFPGIVLGLSGGIDSGLVLAIAVDALGADRVKAVMMPSRYTADISLADASEEARLLGVDYDVISIEPIYQATVEALAGQFAGLPEDTTEENIQSRCRGMVLMAISNKTGRMLLTTGNKSEMAVGYATLYGDMAGGFAPIKDCSKTLVYQLARHRNGIGRVIPERVLTREPSAELRADQKDTDSLPPYDILDPILEYFIEDDLSVDEIAARGFDRAVVGEVLELVKRNEYKRRQAPPGIRVSRRGFGRDWRYPITSGYGPGR